MTTNEWKKIARLLKQAYIELEAQAIKEGVDLFSSEYQEMMDVVRLRILENNGFTLEEYRVAKEEVAGLSKTGIIEGFKRTKKKLTELDERHIPTEDEIEMIADKVAKRYIKPPVINNKIVKEITKPKIIKETIREVDKQVLEELQKDFSTLQQSHVDLYGKVQSIKIPEVPEPVDIEGLKNDLRTEFGDTFQKNIDVLGMPDFRKLAMGLRQDIDDLRANPVDTGLFVPYTGATSNVSLGNFGITSDYLKIASYLQIWNGTGVDFFSDAGVTEVGNIYGDGVGLYTFTNPGLNAGTLDFSDITDSGKTFTFPNASGTIALLESPTFTGTVTTPALTISGLTAGRVLYTSTGGAVAATAGLKYDASTEGLTVVTEGTNAARGIIVEQNQTGIGAALITYRKSRGTNASKTTVAAGDIVGVFSGQGYDGSNYLTDTSLFGFHVSSTVSTGTVPTSIFFNPGDNAFDGYSDGLLVHYTKKVGIGDFGNITNNTISEPSYRLHVKDAAVAGIFADGATGASSIYRATNATTGQRNFSFTNNAAGAMRLSSLNDALNGFVTQNIAYFTYDGAIGLGTATPNTSPFQDVRLCVNEGSLDVVKNGYGRIYFRDTSQALNKKTWEFLNFNTNFSISRLNDANTIRSQYFTIEDGGNVGIGITDPTSLLEVGTYNTSLYTLRTGSFVMQPYALNNGFISENAYFNGTTWTRLNTGYAGGFQFYNGQTLIHNANSGTGNFTQQINSKTDYAGNFAVGANIDSPLNTFTGAYFRVNPSGQLAFGNTEVGTVGFSYVTDALGLNMNPIMKAVGASGTSVFSFSVNSNQPYFAVTDGTVRVFGGHANSTDGAVFGAYSNHGLKLRTNNVNRMTIDTSGNMGVGTESPASAARVHASNSINGEAGIWVTNANTGTSAYSVVRATNSTTSSDSAFMVTLGTSFTTSGAYKQDGAAIGSDSGLSGGLSLVASTGDMRVYTGGVADSNLRLTVTSAGISTFAATSGASVQNTLTATLAAGYTGTSRTDALIATNSVAGTGTSLNTPALNAGVSAAAVATTAGYNVGMRGVAFGSSALNLGFYGDTTAGTATDNVGAFARSGTGGTRNVGGMFALSTAASIPTVSASAALIADNGSTVNAIFIAQDNGSAVFTIADGGQSTFTGAVLSKVLVEANTAGSGSPNILTAAESATVLTNEGVTALNYHTLPTAAAGLIFTFVVQDADGIRVTANTGDTIRIAGVVSGSAGYAESTTIGSTVTLLAINATEWVATSSLGTWSLT